MAYSISAQAAEGEYQKPTAAANIIDYYGYHDDQFYAGVTWDTYSTATKYRDQVYAPLNGKIISVSENKGLGKFIVIEHTDALRTLLGGLDKIDVTEGQEILQGGIVATTVTDKPLYQEVTYLGTPIDPASIIGFKADDFQYFYTEAVDEIERGPYLLISDLDFSQWDNTQEVSLAVQNAVDGVENGTAVYCDPSKGSQEKTSRDGRTTHCCKIDGFVERDDPPQFTGLVVDETCSCSIINEKVTSNARFDEVRKRAITGARHNQPPSSILELMCYSQWAEIASQTGSAYKPPKIPSLKSMVMSSLGVSAYDLHDLANQTVVPASQAWIDGMHGKFSGGGNILDLPGLSVLAYMRAQEFLDRAVDIINDGVRTLAGAVLNSFTGGIFTGFLGISGELTCDTMYRLWNVAEDCYDLKMPEIPDLLGRIKLPGIACELEAFAYGGSGILDAANMVSDYTVYGTKYDPFMPFYIWGRQLETGARRSR
jgi:hypothetical protein